MTTNADEKMREPLNEEIRDQAAFTLEDMRALRWLAIALGVVLAAMSVVIRERAEMLLAAGLIIVMMIASPLAIYLLRKRGARKK